MKKLVAMVIVAAFMLPACVVAPAPHGPHGGAVIIAPPLPSAVILVDEPFYVHGGYHYRYKRHRWYYSSSRKGPWAELPHDRYPKKVRFKYKGKLRDRNPWDDDDRWDDDHDRGRRDDDRGRGYDDDRGRGYDDDRGRGRDDGYRR